MNADDLLAYVVASQGFPGVERLRHRCQEVFRDVRLEGASVLEIGSGGGALAVWASLHGATRVLGLEPDGPGGSNLGANTFEQLVAWSGVSGVTCARHAFQSYDPKGESFDIVLSYNSINHLDESACIKLRNDREARDTYRVLLEKIGRCLRPDGLLILCDCGRTNLWNLFGMKSPIAPTIEWHKHQDPHVWRALLADCGFGQFELSWPPYFTLRRARWLAANQVAAVAGSSHFRLLARRER